jgi:aspartyl/asparaginyl beta-hydroxylase (cupin superfamily)
VFEDTAQFPFAAELERNWLAIRDEMVALRSGFISWPEKSLYGETGWSTLGLYAFGHKQPANCALCPRTTALVESVPGLTTAGFSRLAPGAHIKPHVGYDEYSRYVLRPHLALETNPDCALRVYDHTFAYCDRETSWWVGWRARRTRTIQGGSA